MLVVPTIIGITDIYWWYWLSCLHSFASVCIKTIGVGTMDDALDDHSPLSNYYPLGTASAQTTSARSASRRRAPHPHHIEKKIKPSALTNSARVEDCPSSAPCGRSSSPSPRAWDPPCPSPRCPLAHPPAVVPTESDSRPMPAQRRKATITCMDLSAPTLPT